MEQETLQILQDALSKNQRIGIVLGKNPNIDQMGAALALYLCFKETHQNISVASPTPPTVEISSLVGIDKVKNSLQSQDGDLVVAFPYEEGEIEKVSYTLENGKLNIVVKASENGLSFSEKDVQFKRSGNLPTLLFIIGTPRLSDLGNLFDPQVLKDTMIINIDNNKDNQKFGDLVLVSSDFSSVSEQVAEVIKSLNLSLDIDAAQNLLSGISYATNNFQDQKTSFLAFETAAMLMRKGAVRQLKTSNRKDEFNDQFFSNIVQKQQTGPFLGKQNKFIPKLSQPSSFVRNQQSLQNRSNQQMQHGGQNQSNLRVEDLPEKNPNGLDQILDQKDQQVSPQAPKQSQAWSNSAQAFSKQGGKQATPEEEGGDETPPDWLTPKVYKSKTFI